MADQTPRNNAGDSPKVFGTLGDGSRFLVDRRSDAQEVVVPRGGGFGQAKPKPAAPPASPASDPRGERQATVIKRDPPAQDSAGSPVRVVGGPPKSKPR